MNHQLLKIETPHNTQYTTKQRSTKQHRANTNTRTKNKFRKSKWDYEWGKDYITITKKHGMENS